MRGTPTIDRMLSLVTQVEGLVLTPEQTALTLYFRAMPIYWDALKNPDESQRFEQLEQALTFFERALEQCQDAATILQWFWIGLVKQHPKSTW